MWPLLRFILVNLLATQIKGDAFCSVEDLKVAAEVDREIASAITRWNRHFESSSFLLGLMKSYLQEHERMRNDDLTTIVSNPIHSFQIIRRIVLSVPEIQAQLPKSFEGQSFMDELETLLQKTDLTLTGDLHGAVVGITRLQIGHHLFACDLAEGKISTFDTSARLSLHDCIFIANIARDSNELDLAAEWAECAQNLAGDLNDPLAERTIGHLLESFTISHDEAPHNNTKIAEDDKIEEEKVVKEEGEISYRRFPFSIRGSNKTARQHRQMVFNEINNMVFDRSSWWLQDNFQYEAALCRGKRFLTAEEESKLICILDGSFHPYFYLQPAKLEFQSWDPEVVNIHDFLRDSDIELLKTKARNTLHRSIVGGITEASDISSQRISKTAWVDDYIDERIERISRRIGLLLDMSTNAYVGDAEPFQVVNYGIGGQYYQHHDFLVVHESKDDVIYKDTTSTGDRIATFLIYLSDVPLGGATAFLSAGVAVRPVKGSATFWYNLYSDGNGNTNTFHAGCPVVYGSKWIANKWFREKGQMFTKPCLINDKAETSDSVE